MRVASTKLTLASFPTNRICPQAANTGKGYPFLMLAPKLLTLTNAERWDASMMTLNADKKRKQIQMFCMDDMVPQNHILCMIDKTIDWNFIYELVVDKYSLDNDSRTFKSLYDKIITQRIVRDTGNTRAAA